MEIRYFTVSDVRYFMVIGFLCGVCATIMAILVKNFLAQKTGNLLSSEVPNPLGWHQERPARKKSLDVLAAMLVILTLGLTARAQSIQDSKFNIQHGGLVIGVHQPIAAQPAFVRSAARPGVGNHKFFDRINLLGIAADGGMLALDMYSTRQALQVPGTREANPLMRNPGAAIAIKSGMFAGSIGLAYSLHRSGHERAARVILFTAGIPSLAAGIHNLTIR